MVIESPINNSHTNVCHHHYRTKQDYALWSGKHALDDRAACTVSSVFTVLNMKRIFNIFLIISTLSILLTACGSANKTVTLTISHRSWSGESGSEDSEDNTESHDIKKGDVIQLGGMVDLSVEVISVSDEKIVIKTSSPLSDYDNGTIDLLTDKTEFEIIAGQALALTLVTPTMDAGDIYTFEI